MELPGVERKLRIGDRPWHAEKPSIDWEMTAQKYAHHRKFYTDGSKDDDFTGCGIVDGTEQQHLLRGRGEDS
ncbi:hypothetical protein quinque_014218 [Culex quinquefasciatus]